MEITDFKLWVAVGLVVLAFLYGIWKGFTGRK